MGSFLMSCSLTHQALVGDNIDVYLIPCVLQKNTYSHGNKHSIKSLTQPIYIADIFQPIGVILKASYSDYGLFDLDFNDVSNRVMLLTLLTLLKDKAKVLEQGENEFHDHTVDFNTPELALNESITKEQCSEILALFWDKLQSVIKQDRLILTSKNYKGMEEESEVFFVPVIQKYADRAMELRPPSKSFSEVYEIYLNTNDYFNRDVLNSFSCSSEFCYSVLGNSVLLQHPQMKTSKYKDYMYMLYKLKSLYVACFNMNKMLTPMYSSGQDYDNTLGSSYSLLMHEVFTNNKSIIMENEDIGDSEALALIRYPSRY